MWVSFKSEVLEAIERFIPTKMTKTKYSLPWIDHSIKRLNRHFSLLNVKFAGACGYDFVCDGRRLVRAYLRRRRGAI